MTDIFISYARKDLPKAQQLAHALEKLGWKVWWDRRIPAGKTFTEVIDNALSEARCVIVLWSHTSIESRWVQEEAEEGRNRNILIPAFISQVSAPLGFRRIQACNLIEWNGATDDTNFSKLVEDISLIIGNPLTPIHEMDNNSATNEAKRKAEEDARHKAEEERKKKYLRKKVIIIATLVIAIFVLVTRILQTNIFPTDNKDDNLKQSENRKDIPNPNKVVHDQIFQQNSEYSILIFNKPEQKLKAEKLIAALLSKGFKSSATPSNLTEAIKQLDVNQAWVIYTPKGKEKLPLLKEILPQELNGIRFIYNEKPSSLHNGDVQILLF